MQIDYFRAAESTISSLPSLKRSIPLLEKRLARLAEAGAPKEPNGVDFTKSYVDSHHVNDTLSELLAVAETQREIHATKAEIAEIEKALSELPEDQRKVVTLFYIDKLSAAVIAERIYVESEKTVYKLRNKGVANFAVLYYGALAKDSKR